MTVQSARRLKAVFCEYGAASLIRNRVVTPPGFELDFIETGTPVQGMARMVRNLEFDIVDMSPTTFIAARSAGVPITALPITMYAEFPHALVWTHKASQIAHPAELVGKTIGVRTWLSPATLWLRTMLSAEYGVELDEVRWELTVADTLDVTLPSNAHRTISEPKAFKLLEMVRTGEADAVVDALTLQWHHALEQQKIDPVLVAPLFEDTPAFTADLYRRHGYIPVMHLVVVRSALLEEQPDAAAALIDAFTRAKTQYVDDLGAGRPTASADREAWLAARDRDNRELLELGIDPLPIGDTVARTLDTLARAMTRYGYIAQPIDVRDGIALV